MRFVNGKNCDFMDYEWDIPSGIPKCEGVNAEIEISESIAV